MDNVVNKTTSAKVIDQHVLVTHLHPTDPPADVMIYVEGVELKEFRTILSGIRDTKSY